jgi:hypothetical protein
VSLANVYQPTGSRTWKNTLFAAVLLLTTVSHGSAALATSETAPQAQGPLDAQTLDGVKLQFRELMNLANRHDINAIHEMFWQSPSALLVAKSAVPSDGNWAGFWGNKAMTKSFMTSLHPGQLCSSLTSRS